METRVKRFDKVLVANRGEIAVRVIRGARRAGYRTVAVFSDVDRHSLHVREADEAVHIGAAPAKDSYLRGDAVIAAARRTGAQAIHPGYGFLSENADFARAVMDAGLVWIGPPAEAIEAMGNKSASKERMLAAEVPCVPGYQGSDQTTERLVQEAEAIGVPVMVKAAAGGGGRGMRLVTEPGELAAAIDSARSEAEGAFGSGQILLEKAVVDARHVEIQVFGDRHGNAVHIGERDCSIQRRNQKVVEEAPSPAVDPELRQKMGEAAVAAAKAVGYVGAGTVEFLLAADGAFYFLEMNTRLQVEHPVTELVTGVDLVAWQLRIAAGEPLPMTQDEVTLTGHAIEARLYAEDPARGFLPQTGRLLRFRPAEHLRVDAGVAEGGVVSPHYDPMIAKVIAHAPTRTEACRRLARGLKQSTVFGVTTNKTFLARICEHEGFLGGEATTGFLAERFAGDPSVEVQPPADAAMAAAALARVVESARGLVDDPRDLGWRTGGPVWVTMDLEHGDDVTTVQIHSVGRGRFRIVWDEDEERTVELELVGQNGDTLVLARHGEEGAPAIRMSVRYAMEGATVWIDDGDRVHRIDDVTHRPARAADGKGSGRITAPLDGAVLQTFVQCGAEVKEGDLLLVLEAMKMEHRLLADVDGTLATLHVSTGDQVKTRQLLAEITPKGDE